MRHSSWKHNYLLYFSRHRAVISTLADTKTSQRRRKNVLILVSKTSQIGLKWKPLQPFFKTQSGRLPRNVLKTSSRDVLKKSSRKRPQGFFQETSSRHLPGDLLKTFTRRRPQDIFHETPSRHLKTSRLFLVNKKDDLETI